MKIKSIWMIKVALVLLALTPPFLLPDGRAQSAGQLTIVGKVTNVNQQSGSIIVRGIQIRTDAQTVQSLRSGMIVRISGNRARDYAINASQITQIRAGQTFSTQGLILGKQTAARTISFAGMAVSVPSNAKILSVSKKNLSFANLNNGAGATILMSLSADGKVQAKQIQLFVPTRISGNLEGSSPSRFWLLLDEGMLFGDSATQVTNQNNKPMKFRNLIPGQKVRVNVSRQGDATFYASGVNVLNAENVRLSGIVESWNPVNKTFKVKDYTVHWSAATNVSSPQAGVIDSVRIDNGQFVKVTGKQQSNFVIDASAVQVQSSNRIEVRGILETVSANSITVDGSVFQVSSSTKVEDRRSLPISLSALKAGNVVKVKGVKNSDNSLRANQIELENDVPDSDSEDIEVMGIVEAKTGNSISVSGITIQIVASTKVRGDISKGRAIEAKARSQGSSWIGLEIRQVDTGDIDNGNGNDDNGNDDNGNDDNGNDDNGNDDNGNDDNGNDDNGNDDNGNDDNDNDNDNGNGAF